MGFNADLAFGQVYQEIAKTLILEDEHVVEEPSGCFKPYDFRTNNFKYEVKSDRNAHRYAYRSMFIEYECNGKKSGINATEADFWYYFMVKPGGGHICYEIPIATLKEKCINTRSISGGDGGKVKGYIVPVEGLDYCLID